MVFKKKDDNGISSTEEEINLNIENSNPAIFFNSFDEFFLNYAKKNNINLKWKEPLILHAKSIGLFNYPEKWEECCKHFGI